MERLQTVDLASLKETLNSNRHDISSEFHLRLHRSISWLKKAQNCEFAGNRLVYLWLSLNAAYSYDFGSRGLTETDRFSQFIDKLVVGDKRKNLDQILSGDSISEIRNLLVNPVGYQEYWDSKDGWQLKVEGTIRIVQNAEANKDTLTLISLLMSRLYTLRNINVHGNKDNQIVNDELLKSSCSVLGQLVPVALEIIICNTSVFDEAEASNEQRNVFTLHR